VSARVIESKKRPFNLLKLGPCHANNIFSCIDILLIPVVVCNSVFQTYDLKCFLSL